MEKKIPSPATCVHAAHLTVASFASMLSFSQVTQLTPYCFAFPQTVALITCNSFCDGRLYHFVYFCARARQAQQRHTIRRWRTWRFTATRLHTASPSPSASIPTTHRSFCFPTTPNLHFYLNSVVSWSWQLWIPICFYHPSPSLYCLLHCNLAFPNLTHPCHFRNRAGDDCGSR